jgi:hypothetical protein
MCKSISAYSHDANPAIDPPLFRISRHEATIRLGKGFVLPLSPNTVQVKPPPGWTLDRTDAIAGALFSEHGSRAGQAAGWSGR